ncbi:MAG TPA: S8 family serine peptidase [Mycobacteriales bacterium]|jgi:serine protease AprX
MRRTPALAAAFACAAAAPALAVVAPVPAARQVVVTSPAGSGAAETAVLRAGGQVVARLPLAGGVVARVRPGTRVPGALVAEDRALRVAGLSADPAAASTVRDTLGVADGAGAGTTVALVDTGVAPGADVTVARRYDVTGTGPGDAFGHGTFMAGLVAGRTTGVAPRASVVDVKVADGSGTTSLSLVLRGLEVVALQPDVRVLNLSLASGSPLPYQLDPLTTALRGLWRRGVVVVVPAGNDGPDARTIASPGVDPTLLTVGAADENGTAARSDDTVPAWSSRGPAPQRVAKPDLAAPGAHLLSLRAPGSAIDVANPSARVGDTYFRGSGTSMATAVTSGAVAALLAARPSLTPDAVKGLLTATAYGAAGLADPDAAGAGGLDVAAAYAADARGGRAYRPAPDDDEANLAELARAWAAADLEAAARAWALLGPEARAWAARAWATAVWQRANSWSANSWSGTSWTSDEWLARAWAARAWVSDDWAARAWVARAWAGRAWAGRAWAGSESWDGRAWAETELAGRAWAEAEWSARAWTGRAWAGRAWCAADWS